MNSSTSLIQVFIIEDDIAFGNALCAVVSAADGFCLLGRATTKAEGMAWLKTHSPPADVLLVDLGLPDGSGIDVIADAAKRWPKCSIMVSTHFGDEAHVMKSIEAGASGYLLKDSLPAKVVEEIRSLAAGGSPISPIIARRILNRFRQSPSVDTSLPCEQEEANNLLSKREAQVLSLMAKGFTAQEIADLMSLSLFTVRSFVRRIYKKLQVSSRSEAIFEARALGIFRGERADD